MPYDISKVDIWVGQLPDRPRALMKKLAILNEAGADLEFVISRPEKRGQAVVFMAPVKGATQIAAAKEAELKKAASMHTLRIVGPNEPGLGELITKSLADEGLNLRGVSAAVIGGESVTYLRFANEDGARKAAIALKRALR